MKFWHRTVTSLTRDEIMSAVDDEAWQRFRRLLKGLRTESKLNSLEGYLANKEAVGRCRRVHQVRVDNYINALLRGGQLIRCGDGSIRVQR